MRLVLDMTLKKISKQKEKIGKLDFIKIKNLCVSKGTIKRMKREPTEWEKIFAYHIFDNKLVSRIYNELLQLNNNNKRHNYPI